MEIPTTTVESRVASTHDETGTRTGFRAQIIIWHGLNKIGEKYGPHTRTAIAEAWRDARVMRTHELTKRALPINN